MKFLQKPIVALLLAVVLVPASLLVNTKVRLTAESNELQKSFYENSEEFGKAPAYYVNSRISDAASLATVGSHYEELSAVTEALRQSRSALVDAYEAEDVASMARANEALSQSVDTFSLAAAEVAFSDMDAENYADRIQALAGAQRNLDNDPYNHRVREFDRMLQRNPLAALTGVNAPALFE